MVFIPCLGDGGSCLFKEGSCSHSKAARIREEPSLFSATSVECESRFCGGSFRRRRQQADLVSAGGSEAATGVLQRRSPRGIERCLGGSSDDSSSSDKTRRRRRQQACCGGGGASGSTQAEEVLSSGGRLLQEAAVAGGFRWRWLCPAAGSSRRRQRYMNRRIHPGRRTGPVARQHRYRPAASVLHDLGSLSFFFCCSTVFVWSLPVSV
ncbi:hypothetical protein KSP40_PGU002456 [Platanthera guangdongensis]|uniref:Uncharacterized protein n=1 Tax=Platanthera guangdongensis TaxID=2320717 RepID=A0ABR2LCK6_9ASPA